MRRAFENWQAAAVVLMGLAPAAFSVDNKARLPEPKPTLLAPLAVSNPAAGEPGAPDPQSPTDQLGNVNTPAATERALAEEMQSVANVPKGASFVFRANIETSQPRIALGDIATCSGAAEICAEAYGIDVGASPEPGRSLFLRPDQLKAIIANEWPEQNIRVEAARSIKITASFAAPDDGSINSELKQVLQDNLPADGNLTVAVEKISFVTPVKLRPSGYRIVFPEFTVEHLQNSAWVRKNLSGNQRVTAACVMNSDDEGDSPQEADTAADTDMQAAATTLHPSDTHSVPFTLMVQFTLKEKLPVPARDLAKGDMIKKADLTASFIDSVRGSVANLSDPELIIGRRLKRPAPAFVPLQAAQLELPRAIKRGQHVHLLMHKGGLDVTSQVVALDNAGYGQTLEALYPATKKHLHVRVIDADTVEFAF